MEFSKACLARGIFRLAAGLCLSIAAFSCPDALANDGRGEMKDSFSAGSTASASVSGATGHEPSDADFDAIASGILQTERGAASLDAKTRSLLALTALAAGGSGEGLDGCAAAALDSGASPVEIKECLYQIAPYVGLPRVRAALGPVNAVFARRGIAPEPGSRTRAAGENRLRDGLAVQKKIFGDGHIEKMRNSAPPGQREIVRDLLSSYCFGDFYTRGGLDLKMRELVTFCAIVALGGCDPQARAHAGANVSVGNSKQNLVDALAVMLPYIGFPRTLNGLAAVNAALPD